MTAEPSILDVEPEGDTAGDTAPPEGDVDLLGQSIEPEAPPVQELDKRFYNDEGALHEDGIKSVLEDFNKEKDGLSKQVKDLRRIVSKGKAPEEASKYFEGFKPDEKYQDIINSEDEGMKDILGHFSTKYHELGLSVDQAHTVTNEFLKVLEATSVIDTESPEQKKANAQKWMAKQHEELGENSKTIINSTVKFVESSPLFSESDAKYAKDLMGKEGSPVINLMYRLSKEIGNRDVPVAIKAMSGLPSDAEIKEILSDPSTPESERAKLIQGRRDAGRGALQWS